LNCAQNLMRVWRLELLFIHFYNPVKKNFKKGKKAILIQEK